MQETFTLIKLKAKILATMATRSRIGPTKVLPAGN